MENLEIEKRWKKCANNFCDFHPLYKVEECMGCFVDKHFSDIAWIILHIQKIFNVVYDFFHIIIFSIAASRQKLKFINMFMNNCTFDI